MDTVTEGARKRRHSPWHQQDIWYWQFRPDGTQPCRALPVVWSADNADDAALAVRWCRECPFVQRCRLEALVNPSASLAGVWGGLTPAQLRRQRAQVDYVAKTRALAALESQRSEVREEPTWTA